MMRFVIMKGVGLPTNLIEYVRKVYNRSELFVGHRNTKQGRGVLQGDPLSPCLFNLIIDYILSKLNPDIGVKYAGTMISTLAYADDLILMVSSRQGLEANLGTLARVAARVGLSLGVGKCATVGRQWLGKEKKMIRDFRPFMLGEDPIPTLNIGNFYKYLGIGFSSEGPRKWYCGELRDQTQKLGNAQLKPQQKLFLMRNYLILRFTYRLKHERVSVGSLKETDRAIRSAVRAFLHLPKDVPVPMFHAHPSKEGLGLPEMEHSIYDQLAKLKFDLSRSGPVWQAVTDSIKVPLSRRQRRTEVTDFCEGRGLALSQKQPGCYSWLTDGTMLMSGSTYVEEVKIRLGAVSTKERNNRGRPTDMTELTCDLGCPKVESLGHILQECPATGQLRISRHNKVADVLKRALSDRNWTTIVEPTVPTPAGIRLPDLVAFKDDTAHTLWIPQYVQMPMAHL